MLPYIYIIIGVSVVEHPLGDGGRGMLAVGEDTYLRGPFYEGSVELMPRAARE